MSNKVSESTLSLDSFSPEAKALVGQAQNFADEHKCRYFDPAHLLAVLLDLPDISQLFKDLNINTITFSNQLHNYISKLSTGDNSSALSPTTIAMLTRAKTNLSGAHRAVHIFDLLYSLSQEPQGIVGELCKRTGLTPEKVGAYLYKGKDRDLDSSPYFTNLSLLAKTNKPEVIIGRDHEVRRLIQILGRRSKHNPLLIGEAGVGKRTIIMSLVDRIASSNIPKAFLDATVLQLNTANLLAGAKARADVELRLRTALQSLKGYNVIVYVRTLDALLVPGLNLNLNDLFGMFFEFSGLRVITATSPDGLKKLSDKENHLLQEFTHLCIEPCSAECAVEVLRGVASRYEKHHKIKIGEGAINTAVKLAKRYVQNKFLPESAIDLLDEAASNKMMEVNGTPLKLDKVMSRLASIKAQLTGLAGNSDAITSKAIGTLEGEMHTLTYQLGSMSSMENSEQEVILSEENIATVLGEWTGIPVSKFLEGENEKLGHMEEKLRRRIVGQDEAINAIAKSVRRSYIGLRDPGKPIGSFLFLGSSGVGKTEVAKALAEFLFDDESSMIRVDCSELGEKHNAAKLIGSPNGYQGAEEGGMLTESVRKKPYCVLLFDEVEKAHPDVFNLLLQVLDDGRLTDGRGRLADFSNTIIIMTSNIGSLKILNADKKVFESEEGIASLKEMLHNEMKKFLRPEFINRLDTTIMFRPLAKEQLIGILDIQMQRIQKMLSDREITIKLTEEVKHQLVDIGYEPAYGARPLKRAIMTHIQDPLTDAIVKGKCKNGSTLRFFLHDGRFMVEDITRTD